MDDAMIGTGERPARRWLTRALTVLAVAGVALWTITAGIESPSGPVAFEAGSIVANGRLEEVLHEPELSGRDGGPTVGALSKDAAGRDCRGFEDGIVSGKACVIEGDWRVVELKQR